jgi:AraC-like DNA-binding protein
MAAIKDPTNQSRVSDVAASFGFCREETFWRAFKRHYGMTPGDARLQYSSPHRLEDEFDDWLRRLG